MRWLCAFIRVNNLAGFFDVNFLAHLHIADHCQSSLLGNLLGDFVKGNPDTQYPAMISQGVRLHRFVDSYTDSHSQVEQIRALFPNGVRRYSGIALDMFWDHCLAVQWNQFHVKPLSDFCAQAERQIQDEAIVELPDRFVRTNQAMWQGRWLESYQTLDNIDFALQRMSQRSMRMTRLNECFPYLERNYQQLSAVFSRFYPEVLTASRRF